MPLADDAATFRHFTRTYTRLIGTLDEGLLHTAYSLAEGRVIYELATRLNAQAKEIAQELGMDPGYLSRILAKFQRAGLLKRKVSARDGRVADLALTRRGRKTFETLNALAEKQARGILRSLPPSERTRMIRSMTAIEQALSGDGAKRPPFILRPHRPGDMGWVVHREAALYAEEYGFDETFEALAASIVSDFITNFDPARERCWIAEVDGEAAGHVFLVKHPEEPQIAKLRLLLVESNARGKGLGHALVTECVRFASSAAYRKITLWTQSILTAAHRIYEQAGFRIVREEPHHSFGVDLIGQTWELDLSAPARE